MELTNWQTETLTTKLRRARAIASRGTLFHPLNSDGVQTPAWYTRVTIGGKRVTFELGPRKGEAAKLDASVRAKLREGWSVADIKHWIRGRLNPRAASIVEWSAAASGAPVTPRGGPTVGDVIRVHHTTYFEADPRTTFRYEISLLNLIETAVRHRTGLRPLSRAGRRVTFSDYALILELGADLMDDTLVADFKAARMADVARSSPREKSRKVSTNTELRQARCVFSAEAQLAYKRAGLVLPDLKSFLTAPRFTRVFGRPQLPADGCITGLFARLPELSTTDAPVFDAIALALYAGLRRNEILHAEGSWLQRTAGPSIVVRLADGFRTKNYSERTVPVPEWLYVRLSQRSRSDYFLPGDPSDRRAALERAVSWLRSHGFENSRKPLHSLRGLFAAYLLSTETSPIRIKSRLGHGDLTTTLRFYADEPLSDGVVQLWQSPMKVAV